MPNRQDLTEYTDPNYPYQFVHVRNFDEASLRLQFEKILGCEFLETRAASYWPWNDRLRWHLPVPKFGGLMRRAFLGLRRIHPGSVDRVLPAFYHPDEINIAVRKPAA